jgi:hypothetical protein
VLNKNAARLDFEIEAYLRFFIKEVRLFASAI